MALEKQHVLTKKERAVMRAVYLAADKKSGVCLLSPIDLFDSLSLDLDFDEDELDATLAGLELDDYFDIIDSDRKGEKMYVITLHPNGEAFPRTQLQVRRSIAFKIGLSVGGAIVTFLVGLLLNSIFS